MQLSGNILKVTTFYYASKFNKLKQFNVKETTAFL